MRILRSIPSFVRKKSNAINKEVKPHTIYMTDAMLNADETERYIAVRKGGYDAANKPKSFNAFTMSLIV